jgi:thioredoxin reductase
MKTYDAAVIGAGHNGLIAGLYLAHAGYSSEAKDPLTVWEEPEIIGSQEMPSCAATQKVEQRWQASS